MRKRDLTGYREAFLHWKGWHSFAAFWVRVWRKTHSWSGWKLMFGIPLSLLYFLCAGCASGLIWVFTHGLHMRIPSYFLYALSAYSLTAACVRIPQIMKSGKQWFLRHPALTKMIHNKEKRFRFGLYFEQFLNFTYGSFKIGAGILHGSAWIGADGIYNMVLSLIQLFQIFRRNQPGTLNRQWGSYRLCGVLILVLHLTLTGIVYQTVNWNRAQEQGEIMVIATAAYAFYKLTGSFLSIAKDRRHMHPVDSSIRMLNLAQAIFSIFSLQATMFHTFGNGERWEHLLNMLVGCTVCLLTAATGVYMIRRGTREIKKLQESDHG